MKFSLSSQLHSELKTSGTYAYAVAYVGGFFNSYTPLVLNGQPQPAAYFQLDLPQGASQRQYVVIQHDGDSKLPADLNWSTGGNVNAISRLSAAAKNFQYQLFEVSVSAPTKQSTDVGDISALDTFGLPSKLEVFFSDGTTDTRGFMPGTKGTDIYAAAKTANPNSVLPFSGGGDMLAIGPGASGLGNPWPSGDWATYLGKVLASSATLKDMQLAVSFGGSAFSPTPSMSIYRVSFDGTYVVLSPDKDFKGMPGLNTDYIRMTQTVLQNAIYKQVGAIEISTDGGKTYSPAANFTPDSADGSLAKYLVAGFDGGYWGGSASSPNPLDPTKSQSGQKYADDLNKNWNWNFNNAYDATFNPKVKYDNVLGTGPGTEAGNRFYDPWAQKIVSVSNSYGWSYSDLISQGGVNPQVGIYDKGTGQDVNNLAVTLYSNNETLPADSGFKPSSTGFVAPPHGGYSPVNTAQKDPPAVGPAREMTFAFNFSVGSNTFAPSEKTHAWFKFYAPKDPWAGGDGFVSLAIPKLLDPTTGKVGIWNTLYVYQDPGTGKWSLQDFPPWAARVPNTNPFNATGTFSINTYPTVSDGTTSWYQLEFGEGAHKTVYNIYSSGPADAPTQFVVDHAVPVTLGSSANEHTLTFAPSGSMLYDPATFLRPGHIRGTESNDALVGTASDDAFYASGGNDTIDGGAGTDAAIYLAAASRYGLKVAAGSGAITVQDKVGTDGAARLSSIESVEFADKAIDATSIVKTASLPVAQILKIVDLYTAGLGRAPDAVGLSYYAGRLADGASLSDIAKAIFGSAEAAATFSPANSNSVFIGSAYQTAFGHAPDAAGSAYWLKEIDTGHIQRTDFVTALIAGAQGTDGQYVANRQAVGAHFALTAGLTNAAWARTVESTVTASAATVTAAIAQTDGFAAVAAAPGTSELVVQITGIVP